MARVRELYLSRSSHRSRNDPGSGLHLQTENMNVTHFRPLTKSLTKGNWKRTKEEVDSDSDSSVAPDKLTSDHSSDNIVSDD